MGSNTNNGHEDIRLRHIQQGDHRAFESLFKEYYLPLTRFAWRYVGCEIQAQELVQEVFTGIWEKREELIINEAIKPYLYKSVKNSAFNLLKHQKIKREYDTLWMENKEEISMSEFEEQDFEQKKIEQLRKLIGEAIEDLPPRSRMTYKLHRYDGLTYEEIAEVMSISVKTVESQMTRTLKTLRKRLAVVLPFLLVSLMIG